MALWEARRFDEAFHGTWACFRASADVPGVGRQWQGANLRTRRSKGCLRCDENIDLLGTRSWKGTAAGGTRCWESTRFLCPSVRAAWAQFSNLNNRAFAFRRNGEKSEKIELVLVRNWSRGGERSGPSVLLGR